uniref:Uncharacterized protein n=1 Tax=Anguilla anguilla TaxID=7936 RepID=A0A0E9VSG7_ANGAN
MDIKGSVAISANRHVIKT